MKQMKKAESVYVPKNSGIMVAPERSGGSVNLVCGKRKSRKELLNREVPDQPGEPTVPEVPVSTLDENSNVEEEV